MTQPNVEVIAADDAWLNAGMDAVKEAPPKAAASEPEPNPAPEPAKVESKKEDPPKTGEEAPKVDDASKAAPPTPPAPVVETDKTQEYIKTIHEGNKSLQDTVKVLLEENAKLLAAVHKSKEPAPPVLSVEEVEERAKAEREKLLGDPDAYLKKREEEIKEKVKKEALEEAQASQATSLGFPSVEAMNTHFAAQTGFATIEKQPEKFPLLKDAEFRKLMGEKDNLQAVFTEFPEEMRPSEVMRDPRFWNLAYLRASLAFVTKGMNAEGGKGETGATPDPANLSPSPPNGAPPAKPGKPATLQDEWAQVETAGGKVF